MNVPTIKPTTCPSESELADPEKRWSIVFTHGGRGYLGRVSPVDNVGFVSVVDPFDYASARELTKGDRGEPRIGMQRQIFPAEHFDVDEILVHADVIIALSKLSPKAIEALRGFLIPAWEGRAFMREKGGRVQVVHGFEPTR